MNSKKTVSRSIAIIAMCFMAFTLACKKESDDNKKKLLLLGIALSATETRSYDGLPLVPSVLASSADVSGSRSSLVNDVIPAGDAANSLRTIYAPVRLSVYIGKQMVKSGGELITKIEEVITAYPGLLNNSIAITDKSDALHPGRIVRLSESTTFGAGGRKAEVWWTNTGADPLRDGKMILTLDYRKDTSENIDGVMFFRNLPAERPTEFANARLEFKKEVTATGAYRTAYVQVQNYLDLRGTAGSAAFFITEDQNGLVNVEGGYTLTGQPMPFWEQNVGTDWSTSNQRVYLFNGAGSNAVGKAVVNVILPLRSQSGDVAALAQTFANSRPWSLGELFTDGLLYYCDNTEETFGEQGTHDYLWAVNLLSGASLTTASSQAELIAALNAINTNNLGAGGATVINNLKTVAGILNPVYFYRSWNSAVLVGQQDTDGLEAIVGTAGVTEFQQIQAALPVKFAWFTVEELFNLNLATGATVNVISGHPTSIGTWSSINDAPPTPTL